MAAARHARRRRHAGPRSAARPDAVCDAWKSFASEDAAANARFVEKWRPKVDAVTHARHKGMLKVILGETLEHKRLFDQAGSGRRDLIGKSLDINDHSGDVMPFRWTGD